MENSRLHGSVPGGMPETPAEDRGAKGNRVQKSSRDSLHRIAAPPSPAQPPLLSQVMRGEPYDHRRESSLHQTAQDHPNYFYGYLDGRTEESGAARGATRHSERALRDPYTDFYARGDASATSPRGPSNYPVVSGYGYNQPNHPTGRGEVQHFPTSSGRYEGNELSPGVWGSRDTWGQPLNSQGPWDTQQHQAWSNDPAPCPDGNRWLQYPSQQQYQARDYSTLAPRSDSHQSQYSPQQFVSPSIQNSLTTRRSKGHAEGLPRSRQTPYTVHKVGSVKREPVPGPEPRGGTKAYRGALPIPTPTEAYLLKSQDIPVTLSVPTEKLLILDLNGTLLFRTKGKNMSGSPLGRPHLSEFLDYVFKHFKVMVWSSAQPANAKLMVQALFSKKQREMLLGLWGRDTLGLSKEQYNRKMVVYKLLSRVWGGEFKIPHPRKGIAWDQTNTILVDDSQVKATAQPYNHIEVPEFTGTWEETRGDRILDECMQYLEVLKLQDNVSAFIRQTPFTPRGK